MRLKKEILQHKLFISASTLTSKKPLAFVIHCVSLFPELRSSNHVFRTFPIHRAVVPKVARPPRTITPEKRTAKTSLPTREIGEIGESERVPLCCCVGCRFPHHSIPISPTTTTTTTAVQSSSDKEQWTFVGSHAHTLTASAKEEKTSVDLCCSSLTNTFTQLCLAIRAENALSRRRHFSSSALFCNGRRRRFRLLHHPPVTCPMFAVFCPLSTLSRSVFTLPRTLCFSTFPHYCHFSATVAQIHGIASQIHIHREAERNLETPCLTPRRSGSDGRIKIKSL